MVLGSQLTLLIKGMNTSQSCCHGVGLNQGLEAGSKGGDRVDDRGGVHKELDAELHQEAQVAVFGGEGGDDDAKSEVEVGHHEDEHRGDQDPPVGA